MIPVGIHEFHVQQLFTEAVEILEANLFGPKYYISYYEKYLFLLDGRAQDELESFLAREPNYKYLTSKIEEYTRLRREIHEVPRLVPLNFVALDCGGFNDSLEKNVEDLIQSIIDGQLEINRQLNKM